MTNTTDPDFCAFCGSGLHERTQSGDLKRIGKIFEIPSGDSVNNMQGTSKEKREAKQAFMLKIGVCPDCLQKHNLGRDNLDNLSNIAGQIELKHTENVPERDL